MNDLVRRMRRLDQRVSYVETQDSFPASGSPPTGAAGGVLAGTYPNPSFAAGAIVLTSAAISGVLPPANGGTGINNATRTLTIGTNSGTLTFTGAGKTLSIANSLSLLGTDGKTLTLTGSLEIEADTIIAGGGTLVLAGQTLTISGNGGTLHFPFFSKTLTIAQNLYLDGVSGTMLYLGSRLETTGGDTYLTGGGTLALSGFTLTIPATGTAVLGTGAANRVGYWSGTNTLTSGSGFTYDGSMATLTRDGIVLTVVPVTATGTADVEIKAIGTVGGTGGSARIRFYDNANVGGDLVGAFSNAAGSRYFGFVARKDRDGANIPLRFFTNNASNAASQGLYIEAGTNQGRVMIGASTAPAARLHVIEIDAATNTVVSCLIIGHNSSGTAAASFGTALAIQAESSTTDDRDMGRLRWLWATATDASRAARGVLSAFYTTTERDCITWEANSTVPLIGFLGTTAKALPAAYTLAGTATRTMPTDPSGAYTGIATGVGGTPYAQLADLNTLRAVVSSLEGVIRQILTDLGNASGYGLLNA